jgi:hypothetical protein
MTRRNSLGLALAVALILIATASALVTRALETPTPASQQGAEGDEEEGPPTADAVAHARERLAANGLEVSDEVLTELATRYGVGGAVRMVSWSEGDPVRIADLRPMRDGDGTEGSGMGWGNIAKELGVHPGIGSIMGKGGDHGQPDGPDDR